MRVRLVVWEKPLTRPGEGIHITVRQKDGELATFRCRFEQLGTEVATRWTPVPVVFADDLQAAEVRAGRGIPSPPVSRWKSFINSAIGVCNAGFNWCRHGRTSARRR